MKERVRLGGGGPVALVVWLLVCPCARYQTATAPRITRMTRIGRWYLGWRVSGQKVLRIFCYRNCAAGVARSSHIAFGTHSRDSRHSRSALAYTFFLANSCKISKPSAISCDLTTLRKIDPSRRRRMRCVGDQAWYRKAEPQRPKPASGARRAASAVGGIRRISVALSVLSLPGTITANRSSSA